MESRVSITNLFLLFVCLFCYKFMILVNIHRYSFVQDGSEITAAISLVCIKKKKVFLIQENHYFNIIFILQSSVVADLCLFVYTETILEVMLGICTSFRNVPFFKKNKQWLWRFKIFILWIKGFCFPRAMLINPSPPVRPPKNRYFDLLLKIYIVLKKNKTK